MYEVYAPPNDRNTKRIPQNEKVGYNVGPDIGLSVDTTWDQKCSLIVSFSRIGYLYT